MHRWKAERKVHGLKNSRSMKKASSSTSRQKHTIKAKRKHVGVEFGSVIVGSPLKRACTPSNLTNRSLSQDAKHGNRNASDAVEFLKAVESYARMEVPIMSVPASSSSSFCGIKHESDSSSTTVSQDENSDNEESQRSPLQARTVYQQKKDQQQKAKHINIAPASESIVYNNIIDNVWTEKMNKTLFEAVKLHGEGDWDAVLKCVKDKHNTTVTINNVKSHWADICPVIKGPWQKDQDVLLTKYVNKYGSEKWSVIAAHIPGRSGKQCRERWKNHLDPTLKKAEWDFKEDELLLRAQSRLGNRWSEIAKLLGGRPENAVKNRFNSLRSKKHVAAHQERLHQKISNRNKLLKRSFSAPNCYADNETNHSNTTCGHNGSTLDTNENRLLNMTNKFLGSLNGTKLFSPTAFNTELGANRITGFKSSTSDIEKVTSNMMLSPRPRKQLHSRRYGQSKVLRLTYDFFGAELRRVAVANKSCPGLNQCDGLGDEHQLRKQLQEQSQEIARLRAAVSEVLEENLELRRQESDSSRASSANNSENDGCVSNSEDEENDNVNCLHRKFPAYINNQRTTHSDLTTPPNGCDLGNVPKDSVSYDDFNNFHLKCQNDKVPKSPPTIERKGNSVKDQSGVKFRNNNNRLLTGSQKLSIACGVREDDITTASALLNLGTPR